MKALGRGRAAVAWIKKRMQGPAPQDRWHIATERQALSFLTRRAAELAAAAPGQRVLVLARSAAGHERLCAQLKRLGVAVEMAAVDAVRPRVSPAGVICADLNTVDVVRAARRVMREPLLREVPFEYALVDAKDYRVLMENDVPAYTASHFRSPLLLDAAAPFDIYEESLKRFFLKCDIRDFTEMYQSIHHVVRQQVPGDVAEFGSAWGHSGYLLAQSLRRLGSDKRLYMFDMFEHFPDEKLGVDRFWGRTHPVDFAEVRAKFADLPYVTMVKGDFTETLPRTPIGRLSMVLVDCDSYRGIKFLIENAYPKLSAGGVMVFEDYGHPALLGARLAVDEYFRAADGCWTFFSQFSGCYFVIKLGS